MNNAIITTVELEDREVLTQTKRISGLHIDLDRLDKLNCLSRKICKLRLPAEDIRKEFDGICQGKGIRLEFSFLPVLNSRELSQLFLEEL